MFTAHSNCILWIGARCTATIPLSNDGLCFLAVLCNTPPRTFWIRAILRPRQSRQTDSTSGMHSHTQTHTHTHTHSYTLSFTRSLPLSARHGSQPNSAICWSRTGTSPDHGGSRPGNADHWWTHWSGSPAWTACYRDTESREPSPNRHNADSCRPPGERQYTLQERGGAEGGGEGEDQVESGKGQKKGETEHKGRYQVNHVLCVRMKSEMPF